MIEGDSTLEICDREVTMVQLFGVEYGAIIVILCGRTDLNDRTEVSKRAIVIALGFIRVGSVVQGCGNYFRTPSDDDVPVGQSRQFAGFVTCFL